MGTVSISPQQELILRLVNERLDQLDQAAAPTVSSILSATTRLPPADRIAIHNRLMRIGHPDTRWATSLR